jgi:hydroxymethylbilane synthase
MTTLRIGTRGSQLALFQANAVAALLRDRAEVSSEIVVIKTAGDRLAEAPLAEIGGKRLFVKEIEDALLDGAVDVAVHSSKDMPAVLPGGLAIGAVLPREDPCDAIVLPSGAAGSATNALDEVVRRLGTAPRIGTSSVRRAAQLRGLFPQATFTAIRGNLDTRLRKVDAGDFDALILAAAGLRRLGRHERISATLPAEWCVPAPGQGIIAVEMRTGSGDLRTALARIDDPVTAAALRAERAVVTRLGGGCQMPLGAYASISGGRLSLVSVVMSLDGSRAVRAEAEGPLSDAEDLGVRAAVRLLDQGAAEILADADRARAAVEGLQP